MRDIGKNIRTLRQRKKMTQEELAQALFVTRQTVSNYETGKSRPDVEMVCKIAEVLGVDANTVLYGTETHRGQRRELRRFIISGIILAVMAGVYYSLYPLCRDWYRFFITAPRLTLETLWAPVMAGVFGWWIMQGAALRLKAKPLEKSWTCKARRILLGVLLFGIAVMIPYLIFWAVGDYRMLRYDSVSMSFPYIPVYSDFAYGLIGLHHRAAWLYALPGALLWVFGFPGDKETDNSRCA